MWMGRVALSSLYRREIESRVNDAICENAYCNIGLMGGAGPGDDRKKSHHFRDLQQGKGALRHQESFPILVEATYLAPLAIFFFRDEFAADSPLQGRVCELSVPDGGRSPSRSRHRHQSRRWSICWLWITPATGRASPIRERIIESPARGTPDPVGGDPPRRTAGIRATPISSRSAERLYEPSELARAR